MTSAAPQWRFKVRYLPLLNLVEDWESLAALAI